MWADQRESLQRALQRSKPRPFAHTHFLAHVPLPSLPSLAGTEGAGEAGEAGEAGGALVTDAHPVKAECERWAAGGECRSNAGFMQTACAASCYLALAMLPGSSPELAAHNGWLVTTDSAPTFRVVCAASLTTCT